MKKSIQLALTAFLALALQTKALAETTAPHPCKAVEAACEAAGFAAHQHKQGGKGLWMDCLRPLFSGQSVAGVNLPPAELAACQSHRAKRRKAGQQQ